MTRSLGVKLHGAGTSCGMNAIVIDRFNEPGALREVPVPELDPKGVLIRVTAAGVNPVDWKIRDGKAGEKSFPLVLGQDFAGVIERTGANVTRVKPGDRVFGCARAHGSYTELTVVDDGVKDSPFAVIPDGIEDAIAAALPTPCLTALGALDILQVGDGTSLLIVGSGAVGSAAVQMAHARGARVTAVVKPGHEDETRAAGADEVIGADKDVRAAVQRVHAEPFAAVLDLVSDAETLKANAPLVQSGGRLVTTIHVADEAWFAAKNVSATNIVMNETAQSSPQGLDDVTTMILERTLSVKVDERRALADAPAVLDGLRDGKLHGKIVLTVGA